MSPLYDRHPAPAEISPTYRLRYSQEHSYCFSKMVLLRDGSWLCNLVRTGLWTQVVACAHNRQEELLACIAGLSEVIEVGADFIQFHLLLNDAEQTERLAEIIGEVMNG